MAPVARAMASLSRAQGDQRDPDAANDSRHNVVIDNTFDGRHLRHAILLQFPTHNNLVAENNIVGSLLDAIDLHGEGEYLNEVRDNTVIGGQPAGIARQLAGPRTSMTPQDLETGCTPMT